MGASNALAAYLLYAGRVPPLSMQVLTYMALISVDADPSPWFGMGHEALAVHALGREAPVGRADIKAVERAVQPLLSLGVIEADRRPAIRRDGANTVRYKLRLVAMPPEDIDETAVDDEMQDSARPPESGHDVPRNPGSRPPESVPTSPEIRGTEEKEKYEEREEEGNNDLRTDLAVSRARTITANSELTSVDGACTGCGVLLDPDGACRHRPCPHYLAPVIPLTA